VLSTDTSTMPCYFWRVGDGNYVPPGEWARFAHHRIARIAADVVGRRVEQRDSSRMGRLGRFCGGRVIPAEAPRAVASNSVEDAVTWRVWTDISSQNTSSSC
jgi:hypothetical protein